MSNQIITIDASANSIFESQYTTITTATTVPTSRIIVTNTTSVPIILARGLGALSPYAPASQAFFAAAPVTDPAQKLAVDTAYRALVASGQYALLNRWYPCVGDTLSASLMDFVTLSRATSFGDPISYFPDSGWFFDNGTNYIKTGFIPSSSPGSLWIEDDGHMGLFFSASFLSAAGIACGADNGAGLLSALQYNFSQLFASINKPATGPYEGCGFNGGSHIIQRIGTNVTHLYIQGIDVFDDSTVASFTTQNNEIYIGALNNNGTASDFWAQDYAIAGFHCGEGGIGPDVVAGILTDMNISLNRNNL